MTRPKARVVNLLVSDRASADPLQAVDAYDVTDLGFEPRWVDSDEESAEAFIRALEDLEPIAVFEAPTLEWAMADAISHAKERGWIPWTGDWRDYRI